MDLNAIFFPNKAKLAAIAVVLFLMFFYFYYNLGIPVQCLNTDSQCLLNGQFLKIQGAFFITIISGIPVSLVVFLAIGLVQGKQG